MLGETTARELLLRALQTLGPDVEADAYLVAGDSALTRFANNQIHQNVAETGAHVTVRAVLGKRTGQATTNDLSPAGLERAARSALAFARIQPEVPDFPGLPAPAPIAGVQAFDEAVAACTPAQRAQAIGALCARAAAQDLTAAGAFETAVVEQAVVSTRGVRAYEAGTRADFQTVIMGADSSGWAHATTWRLDDLDPAALGEEALNTAIQARGPRPIEPGTYPVVLGPDAVQDVVSWIASGASAQDIQEGRSWMNGREGQVLMSPAVSIWDDGHDPRGVPTAFDGEGMPKQRVDIVRAGAVGDAVYDTLTAAREPGRHTTGHALPPLSPQMRHYSPQALNVHMAAGDAGLPDLLAAAGRGVYVTRFWYTRVVHPRDVTITGLTRDGTFWIEDGALAYPVQILRFTQAYLPALAHVLAAGRVLRTGSEGWGTVTVPAVALEQFTFTGVSPRG